MTRRTVIIAPPPTPNGDLHTGHLAGPYLAGDVYARYLRASDRPVIFTSGTDDSQTYVVASAARAGLTPEELALRSATQIRATLEAAGVSVDGFAPSTRATARPSSTSSPTSTARARSDSGRCGCRTSRPPAST